MSFTHIVAEDSSKLALSVLGQLYFLCLQFYRSYKPLWVGFSFPLLFKLDLISPSIFFLQLLFPLNIQRCTSSSLRFMPPSKENRDHERLCSERTQTSIVETRHHLILDVGKLLSLGTLPCPSQWNKYRCLWPGLLCDTWILVQKSKQHKRLYRQPKLSKTVLVFDRHMWEAWICASSQEAGTHLTEDFLLASSSLVLGLLTNLSSPVPQHFRNMYHVVSIIKCFFYRSNARHDAYATLQTCLVLFNRGRNFTA